MIEKPTRRPNGARSQLALGVLAALVILAACGSSSKTSTSSGAAGAAPPIGTATVSGVGLVLVDGSGHTLYILTSEKGGTVTCTNATGCTKAWPPAVLPSGVTHGSAGVGVTATLLGTVKDSAGALRLTYASYPLYRFSGDAGGGTAKGEGITSFGGTWEAMAPSGTPVTPPGTASTPTTAASSSSGGYGY